MPIVDGKYEAPIWINDSAPAINAAELQAICDRLQALDAKSPLLTSATQQAFNAAFGTTPASVDDALAKVPTLNIRVANGSYTGAMASVGTVVPVSLNIGFTPKLLLISSKARQGSSSSIYNTTCEYTAPLIYPSNAGLANEFYDLSGADHYVHAYPVSISWGATTTLSQGSFHLGDYGVFALNRDGIKYYWFAIG